MALSLFYSPRQTRRPAPEGNLPKVTRSAGGEPRWTLTCVTSASTLSCSDKSDGGLAALEKP